MRLLIFTFYYFSSVFLALFFNSFFSLFNFSLKLLILFLLSFFSTANLFVTILLINIFFKTSSLTSAIKVPSFATEIFPVSSDTTTTTLSDSLDAPIAALCLVPNSFAISLSSASGSTHAAAAILFPDITTAPS